MGGTKGNTLSRTGSVLKKYEIKSSWNDRYTDIMSLMQLYMVDINIVLFSFHPYLFFNEDNDSMTFMGFFIKNCNAVDPVTNQVVVPNVISTALFNELTSQRFVNLSEDYRNWLA